MAQKYTKSKDGVMRTNVYVQVRFTKEELAAYEAGAKAIGLKGGIRQFLRQACNDAMDWDLPRRYEEETGESFDSVLTKKEQGS